MIKCNIVRETKYVTTSKYPFVIFPKLAFNRGAFYFFGIILFVVGWYREESALVSQLSPWSEVSIRP